MKQAQPALTKLTWKDVHAEVSAVNPGLAEVIDELKLTPEHCIYKLRCPWGQQLLLEGTLYLPNAKGEWVSIHDASIDSKMREDLVYNNNMPLGMSLNNSLELYLYVLGRIIPFVFFKPGKVFGMWLSLQYKANAANYSGWTGSIIAGSRSLKLMPKISDAQAFKQLKKSFALNSTLSTHLSDQWQLLYELANHPDFPEPWTVDVIYFSRKWFEVSEDVSWKLFKKYLLEQAWNNTAYLRNQFIFDVVFSCALEEKNLRPNPYLTDTVKHLYTLAQNTYPGYVLANDSSALPLKGFQQVFKDIYGLRYVPTIMQPEYLNRDGALYYSLEYPTLMAFSPRSRKASNKLEDLREIKHILERTQQYFLEEKLKLNDTPLLAIIKKINFDYYHTDNDSYGLIKPTDLLPSVDSILAEQLRLFPDKLFCESSPFLRGCIRISKDK